MNFDPDQFDINEDYEKDWTKTYNYDKGKFQYETRKKNNGNVSLPPLIIEKENFVHVFNQLNLPSSSSSSNSSSSSSSSSFSNFSSSSSSRSSNYSTNFAMFTSLKSLALAYSAQANLIVDVDGYNEL
jgi:hypothetical protein